LTEINPVSVFYPFYMPIIKTKLKSEFVNLPNGTARDRRLTLEASGYLAHLLSYSDEFKPTIKSLKKMFGVGRDKIHSLNRQLKFFGYLTIEPGHADGGEFDGAIWTYSNVSEFPDRTKEEFTASLKTRTPAKPGSAETGIRGSSDPPLNNGFKKTGLIRKTGKEKIEQTNENARPRDLAFAWIAFLSLGIPIDKSEFVSSGLTKIINDELDVLEKMDADLSQIQYFGKCWAENYRSKDRSTGKFQRPRIRQFRELWFEFMTADILTDAQNDRDDQDYDYSQFNK
jgi:hypothetical protein